MYTFHELGFFILFLQTYKIIYHVYIFYELGISILFLQTYKII